MSVLYSAPYPAGAAARLPAELQPTGELSALYATAKAIGQRATSPHTTPLNRNDSDRGKAINTQVGGNETKHPSKTIKQKRPASNATLRHRHIAFVTFRL